MSSQFYREVKVRKGTEIVRMGGGRIRLCTGGSIRHQKTQRKMNMDSRHAEGGVCGTWPYAVVHTSMTSA